MLPPEATPAEWIKYYDFRGDWEMLSPDIIRMLSEPADAQHSPFTAVLTIDEEARERLEKPEELNLSSKPVKWNAKRERFEIIGCTIEDIRQCFHITKQKSQIGANDTMSFHLKREYRWIQRIS